MGEIPRGLKITCGVIAGVIVGGLALVGGCIVMVGACLQAGLEEVAQEIEQAAREAEAQATQQAEAKPKEEEAEPEEKEEEGPLPEEIADWVTDHYYRARREGDPRLPEAVAYLGEHFAGTPQADSAAVLLTNLLKKSEEPKPKPGAGQPARGAPPGYPGGMPPGYPGARSRGMGEESSYMEEEESEYREEEESQYTEEMEEEGYSEGMPGMYAPPGYGPPGARPTATRRQGSVAVLIRAIVSALGVNDSKTAHQTLREVVEGTFETDDNRGATLATLETFVAHLCPEYEEILYRCLTEPEKLRALGKQGQAGRPGQPPPGYPGSGMYGPGYPSPGGRTGSGPLTAEELQREAFSWIAPKASEEFRARLAKHLADPQTPQEDLRLFGDYLREASPENVAAQMVLYLAAGMDPQTKETIEVNFLGFSSDALAGILGVPVDQRARRSSRRQQRRGPGMYPGTEEYPGMEEEQGYDQGYMPTEEEEGGAMGRPPGYPGRSYPGQPARPGMGPGPSGRPSRYDTQALGGGRPSRYDPAQPGAQAPIAAEFQRSDPDLPYRLARHMWAGQMSNLVESRLNQIDSLESGARLLLLASTMPVDSTRATLHQVLQRRWEDGPRGLELAGLLDEVISDPGFLVLVKMLPRKAPPQETAPIRPGFGRTRSGRPPAGRPGYGRSPEEEEGPGRMMPEEMRPGAEGYMAPGMGPREPGRRPGDTPDEPDLAWMATSEELVRVLCERLLAAAKSAGAPAQEGELPFEVRADASVVAEYHLDWPGSQQQKLSGVPLGELKLHYVRAELDTRLSTLESYYRRQLGSPEERPIQNGTWMESLSTVPDTDWKRSVDLMFTATVPAGEQLDKKQQLPVTVDILCIDIKNPAPGAAGN